MTEIDTHRHDLKNQLSIILGFSEMLLASAEGDQRRRDFEQIHRAATAALALIARVFPIAAGPVAATGPPRTKEAQ